LSIKKKYLFIFILLFILSFPMWGFSANHYVRSGSSGDGSSWSSAWDDLPSSLTRDDTYYVADGSYSSYTFDDSVDSTKLITIKKATVADHGTSTGWSDSYGDGQATFGRLTFSTSYFTFTGVTRDAGDWSDNSAYGFYVDGGTSGNGAKLFNVSGADNITIRYVYAAYDYVLGGEDISENQNHGLYSTGGSNNITMEYCFIKNTSWKAAILINSSTGPFVVRYNRFENIGKKELWSARGTDNVTFAYNYCKNIAGTGAIVADDSDDWDIYGNIIWNPSESYTFSDVTIGTWTGDHPSRNETLNNWKIYNNTFYDVHDQIQIQHGTGNEVRNTLVIGESISINGSLTASHNDQNASTSVVTDAANGDFTLSTATTAGYSLSSPYNVDMNGNTRGSDGTWDRGAYEYVAEDSSPPTLQSATIASNGTTLTLVFDENVTQGSGYDDSDWDLDSGQQGDNVSITYESGDGTTTHIYNISKTIWIGDTANIDFNGDANSEEDGSGNDLAAIVSDSVVNNSIVNLTALGLQIQ